MPRKKMSEVRGPRSEVTRLRTSHFGLRTSHFGLRTSDCIILVVINVEVLAIGNEILLGLVQDTNSNYLCRVVRGMGGRVRHIATPRDEIEAIADDIGASLARNAQLIVTCGGLGPTEDDVTLAAVARATSRKLELNVAAQAFVEQRYRELASEGHVSSAAMDEARLKMARIPTEAQPVANPVGAAPAVLLDLSQTKIVSLPGVPAELKAIVEGPLRTFLAGVFGRGSYREREITVECGDESLLAPALGKVAAAHPEVYLKSRPNRFGPEERFRILISSSARTDKQAEQMIESAQSDLVRLLKNSGIH